MLESVRVLDNTPFMVRVSIVSQSVTQKRPDVISPEHKLAAAVLKTAVQDAREGDVSAWEFLFSENPLFSFWCHVLGANAVVLRRELRRLLYV